MAKKKKHPAKKKKSISYAVMGSVMVILGIFVIVMGHISNFVVPSYIAGILIGLVGVHLFREQI